MHGLFAFLYPLLRRAELVEPDDGRLGRAMLATMKSTRWEQRPARA